MEIEPGLTNVTVLPMCHSYGIASMNMAMLLGGSKTVTLKALDIEAIFKAIEEYKANFLAAVPTLYIYMLMMTDSLKKYDISSMKYWSCGSAPLTVDTWQRSTLRYFLLHNLLLFQSNLKNRPDNVNMVANQKIKEIPSKDHYFFQNVFGISAVEFLWGLGLPVVVESTFLQLFLKNMGASSLAIGMIPTLFFIGCSIFALLSSYLTDRLAFKRKAVILLHLVSAVSLLLFGSALLLFAAAKFLLILFFVCYSIFCICIGMTLPVWLSYLVNIFSAQKSVAGLGYMNVFQNLGKFISSILLLKIVEAHAFSMQSAAVVFMIVGGLFGVGSLFFYFTKELPDNDAGVPPVSRSLWCYARDSLCHMVKNRNFLLFMIADLEFFAVVTVISFYANYAAIYCGIDPAVAAGLFVAFIYVGAVTTNILMGSMGLLTIKNKTYFSKIFSFIAMLVLVFSTAQWGFLLASFLLGASRGIRMIIMPPAVKLLSGLSDATSYFAFGSILTLPIAVGLPIVAGYFLDRFSSLGGDSYRVIFGGGAAFILLTVFFLIKVDFSGHHSKNRREA